MAIFEEATAIPESEVVSALSTILGQLALVADEYRGTIGDTEAAFLHDVENYDMGDPRRRGSVIVLQYVKFPAVQTESDRAQIQLKNGTLVNRDVQGFVQRIVNDHHNYTLAQNDNSMVNFDIAKKGIADPGGNLDIHPDTDLFIRNHELSLAFAKSIESPTVKDFADLKSDGVLSQETYNQDWSGCVGVLAVVTINRRDRLVPLTHLADMYNEPSTEDVTVEQ